MDIVFAIILGTLFGFVLQRVGASDPDKIVGMLTLRDLHLMKAIFMGIGVSSILLFAGLTYGLLDSGNLSVKSMYWGVVVGGVLLGLGWAIAGFCPGTAVVALGSGRKDAAFFLVGGLLGAGFFTAGYASLQGTWLLEEVLGGKTTLVTAGDYNTLIEAPWSPVVALVLGLVMVVIAKLLPQQ